MALSGAQKTRIGAAISGIASKLTILPKGESIVIVEIHPPTAIRYIVASNQSLTISKKRNNIVIPSKN